MWARESTPQSGPGLVAHGVHCEYVTEGSLCHTHTRDALRVPFLENGAQA